MHGNHDLEPLATHVLWLNDPRCADRARSGGKAAQLSRLRARYPVPPGFCLPAPALSTLIGDRRSAPGALVDLLEIAYAELAVRAGTAALRVAVRSSALDEDGQAASFAGQHETYLNLASVEQIATGVMDCWRSARSTRVQSYRRLHGLPLDSLQLAILVQQLVLADTSAVVFSANPVTGNRDELVITASYGLGESMVGGTVTPDTWIVARPGREIVSRQIGMKGRMTVLAPGGTREIDVPRILRDRPSLEPEQVDELARLALALEDEMGWPVDIECAFAGGRLYLLQCRPITTLAASADVHAAGHAP